MRAAQEPAWGKKAEEAGAHTWARAQLSMAGCKVCCWPPPGTPDSIFLGPSCGFTLAALVPLALQLPASLGSLLQTLIT